jgi:hypothetical protein
VYQVRKAFALFLLCAVTGTVLPARAARAAGTSGEGDDTTPSFTLLDQPAAVHRGQEFALRLKLKPASTDNLDVRVVLHDDINTRSGFEQTVAGDALGSTVDRAEVALDDLKLRKGAVTATFGLPDADLPAEQTLRPKGTGVYPLEVELRRDGTVLDSFVSWLVYVNSDGSEDPISEPLSFAWVWSVKGAPAYESDGTTPNPEVLTQMMPGGRLADIASLLAQADGVPLTLDLSPETLKSWLEFAGERRQLRAGANAVRIAAGAKQNSLLLAPYVPIDLPAFQHAGFGEYLSREYIAGSDTLRRLTDARVDSRTALADPVDSGSLNRLREFLVDRVLVREEALVPRDPAPSLTSSRPFLLSAGDTNITATSTNPTVTNWLQGDEPPALRAQRFLAGLSLIALEAPGKARGIVVATPRDWDPDTAAVSRVLRGLRTDPLLQAVTLDGYFDKVALETDDAGQPLQRTLATSPPSTGYPLTLTDYRHAERSLSSFRTVVGASDASIQHAEQALLVALSSQLTPARAAQELAVIDRAAASFLGQITTTAQRVTISARRAQIPLTFSNGTGQQVRVRIRLDAPSGKALFPDGAERTITLEPGNQTKRFAVEARATGTFAMTVTLTSEDGQLPIGAPTEITVRSTVFSGWGAALTVGALAFLAFWWVNHIRRSRRAAREAAAQ